MTSSETIRSHFGSRCLRCRQPRAGYKYWAQLSRTNWNDTVKIWLHTFHNDGREAGLYEPSRGTSPDRPLYRWCNMECAAGATETEFDTLTDAGLQLKSFVKVMGCMWEFLISRAGTGVHRGSPRGEGPRASLHHETPIRGCTLVGGVAPPSLGNDLAQPQCKCGYGRVLLIVGDSTAIMISPRVQLAWQKAECFCQTAQGASSSMIEIEVAKTRYHLIATCLPDVSKGAAVRKEAWKILGEWREALSSKRQCPGRRLQQLWGGDWNSHIGQDAHERTSTQVGKFSNRQPTTAGGRQMQQWLTEDAVELQLVDTRALSRPAHPKFGSNWMPW